jgi:hypothetical protein
VWIVVSQTVAVWVDWKEICWVDWKVFYMVGVLDCCLELLLAVLKGLISGFLMVVWMEI